jgi:chemotaxis protein methyltransferase CheR
MDPADVRAYREFDVVFCRNLLIYFDDLSRRQTAETFFDALKPGGFLCLGHSESMSRISSLFRVRKFPEAIVYQKVKDER